jgi:hypothetical protein
MNSEDTQAVSQQVVEVLLVSPFDEDHLHLRDILKHSNWQQHEARTQKESFEFLRENVAPVVICESELPDGTWQDVLSEVLNLGGYDVLAKPLNTKEVFHVAGLAWMSWKQRWQRQQPLAMTA